MCQGLCKVLYKNYILQKENLGHRGRGGKRQDLKIEEMCPKAFQVELLFYCDLKSKAYTTSK